MREIEGVGTVELVYVGRLLRMGYDSLLMPVCGSERWGTIIQNELSWEHFVENR